MKIRSTVLLGSLLFAGLPALQAQYCQPVLVNQKIQPTVATVSGAMCRITRARWLPASV